MVFTRIVVSMLKCGFLVAIMVMGGACHTTSSGSRSASSGYTTVGEMMWAPERNREVAITSDPPGGVLSVNGSYLGETPLKIKLSQIAGPYGPREWEFVVEKPGYEVATKRVLDGGRGAGAIPATFQFALVPLKQATENAASSSIAAQARSGGKDSPQAFGASRAFALVVGISKYQLSPQNGLENLIYADEDARAFTACLRKQGWNDSQIKLLINEQATERNIKVALESWLTKAGPNDLIVLFWSGHGMPDPEDPDKVYFVCHDTDVNIPATGFRMDRVRGILEERKVRNVVVFADTCHAGKLITRGNQKAIGVEPYVNRLDKEKSVPKGWIFMVAADTDRTAIEHSSWSNGAFTHCLLDALKGKADGYQGVGPKDGVVTMLELRTYLSTTMPDETQRVLGVAKRPIITTSSGDSQIWNLDLRGR